MAESQIGYVRTKNGTSIAYTVLGTGPPLVHSRVWAQSIQTAMRIPFDDVGSAELSQRTALVLYDHAGVGASQRDITDYSLDAQAQEIEAVVDRLGFQHQTELHREGKGPGTVVDLRAGLQAHGHVRRRGADVSDG